MSSIVDERGFDQAYQLNIAQRARLQRLIVKDCLWQMIFLQDLAPTRVCS